jgi:hypothetical protein
MVTPAETLVVMIEAAAALAGFAGIVVALRRESWTVLDGLQIRNLLSCAFSALFFSILALVLLHAGLPDAMIWQILSAIYVLVGVVMTTKNAFLYTRLRKSAGERFPSFANLFWFGTGIMVIALVMYNAIQLATFWPVLVCISWLFGLTCYSFWQLLIRHN